MSYGYSCNDNQNYFVDGGRTTSRVSQLPGGRSSINLSWDDGTETREKANLKRKDIPQAPGSSTFSLKWDDGTEAREKENLKMEDIPQAPGSSTLSLKWGNDDTETTEKENLKRDDMPKAPGSSTLSLKWGNDGTEAKKENLTRNGIPNGTHSVENYGSELKDKAETSRNISRPSAGMSSMSSNAFASGNNQNSGNMITDRPTSRVLNPPGGRSSITFG